MRRVMIGLLLANTMLLIACTKPRTPASPTRPQPDPPPGICTDTEYKRCPPK